LGPLNTIAPFIAALLLVVIVVWIFAVLALSKEFKIACDKQEKEAVEAN
jgi:ATP/ADP translocase